jgi:signal transduction histidine kinase/ActR/RegA family two-component response regulator
LGLAVITPALDSFSRQLRRVETYDQLVALVRDEVSERFGLTNAWLYVCEREDEVQLELVAAAGTRTAAIRELAPVIPRAGDALVDALLRDEGPVVIADAQAGEFPEVTRRLGNRTVVNIPMSVVDHALGILGCGTFGDEGVVPIGEDAIRLLTQLANMTSVALARMILRKRDRERVELHARLAQRQRLESLGLLAGGVAHDFNNLMTVIRLSVRLLSEGSLTADQRADLDLIRDAEDSASQLTQKLLMLGQKQPLRVESVDINATVQGFMSLVRRLLPANIQTDVVAGAALPRLQLDPFQVEQVLMNLALNARDAMPAGGRLTIETEQIVVNGDYRRAHPWARPGRYVLVTVSDTGVGMAPDVLERVFEPFFTTKSPGEGTGLGLAVAWSIVQQHGGMIHAYSEVGMGTAFKVYLPAAEQVASQVAKKIVGAVPRGVESILVADDQPHVLHLLKRVLHGAGYRVTTAADGAEAVKAAAVQPFDLYLFDAVMPRLSGREACERIRAQQPAARFLFASGYGAEALPASFLKDMGVETIPKPLDPDTLLRAVRAVLDAPARTP